MKFKALVSIVALAAAGAANAKVQSPVETTSGGEMSFTVFSATAQASFIYDTGISLTAFRAGAVAATGASPYTLNVNLTGNTEFQSFLSLVASTGATDVGFSFFGGDNSGNPANARTMISSVGTSGDATLVTNGNMVDSMNFINNNYLSTINIDPRFVGAANANASGTFVKGSGGNGYFLEVLGTDFQSKFQPTDGTLNGDAIGVYDFVRSSTSSGGDAIEVKLGTASLSSTAGQYKFSFSTPVTPAVPEPESYALLFVGLGLIGATVARRRAK